MVDPLMSAQQYDAWVDFLAQAAISNADADTYERGRKLYVTWIQKERNLIHLAEREAFRAAVTVHLPRPGTNAARGG